MSAALTLDLGMVHRPHGRSTPGVRTTSDAARTPPRLIGPRRRLTLDEIVVGAWEGLGAGRQVSCVVCGGPMLPAPGPRSAGGSCQDCGTTLS
jgi:hypothetical protein